MSVVIVATKDGGNRRCCDSKCHDARGKKCVCICGGKNHGVGAMQAYENMTPRFRHILRVELLDADVRYPQYQGELIFKPKPETEVNQ